MKIVIIAAMWILTVLIWIALVRGGTQFDEDWVDIWQ